jgi:hypothetical protein
MAAEDYHSFDDYDPDEAAEEPYCLRQVRVVRKTAKAFLVTREEPGRLMCAWVPRSQVEPGWEGSQPAIGKLVDLPITDWISTRVEWRPWRRS